MSKKDERTDVGRAETGKHRRTRIDPDLLRSVTDALPEDSESSGDFIRRIRDEARY